MSPKFELGTRKSCADLMIEKVKKNCGDDDDDDDDNSNPKPTTATEFSEESA